jgi:hypothetical protein
MANTSHQDPSAIQGGGFFLPPLVPEPFWDPSIYNIEGENDQYDPAAGQFPEQLPQLGGGLDLGNPQSPDENFWNPFFPHPPDQAVEEHQLFFG